MIIVTGVILVWGSLFSRRFCVKSSTQYSEFKYLQFSDAITEARGLGSQLKLEAPDADSRALPYPGQPKAGA